MLVLLLLLPILAANIGCVSPGCSSCSSGVLVNYQCLDKCPLPNDPSKIPCYTSFYLVFYQKFYTQISFNEHQFGDFTTPDSLPFSSLTKTGPIPTFNQGFYFTANSSLIYTTSDYYNSEITFDLCGIFKRPGKIFRIMSGGLDYFRIYTTVDEIVFEILLQNETSTQIWSISTLLSINNWDVFTFSTIQRKDNTIVAKIYKKLNSKIITISNFEYRSFPLSGELIFGSMNSDGFEGFLMEAKYMAYYNYYSSYYTFTETCFYDYNEYCLNDVPVTCESGCSSWPWCVDSSCNYCYSQGCESCTGYGYLDCTKCKNSTSTPPFCECGPYCKLCTSTFICKECDDGYVLIDTICTLSPYNYNGVSLNAPVIDYIFDSYEKFKAGVFQSGNNPDTYYPYNHEADDPWILEYRGAFMNSSQLFKVKTDLNLYLNYQFTVGVWILTSNTNLIDFGNLQVQNKGRCTMILTGVDKQFSLNVGINNPIQTFWIFYSVAVKFVDETTTVSIVNDLARETLYSIAGYIYISSNSPVTISSSYNSYFLYALVIYQTYKEINSGYLMGYKRMDCPKYKYYNWYINKCLNCMEQEAGCINFGSYSLCKLSGCQECDGYDSACIETSSSNCTNGTYLVNSKCCDMSCLDCFNYNSFSCFSCSSGAQFLLGHVCVDICPSGFEGLDGLCKVVDSNFVHIVFDTYLFDFMDLQNNVRVLAGDSVTIYPDVLNSQPIPSYKRGFYFRETSYVKTSNISLSYNITLFFYAKVEENGVLLTKGRIKLEIEANGLHVFDTLTGYGARFGFTKHIWQTIVVKLYGTITPEQAISVSINSGVGMPYYTGDIVFESEDSEIILGLSGSAFTGFLYEFKLINELETLSNTVELCTTQITSTCIIDCPIDTFYNFGTSLNSECSPCLNCPYGCINNISCSICEDQLCNYCSSYDAVCSVCNSNSILTESICQCELGYYHNLNTNTCDKCLNNCLSCSSLNDCNCFDNSHAVELNCECNTGFAFNDTQSCVLCHETCSNCSGLEYYNCLECSQGYYLLKSLCLSQCPVGFKIVEGICEGKAISLNFKFDRLDGKFIDSVSGVKGKAGKKSLFYPFMDESDPWPVYLRGLYFNNAVFTFPEQDDIFILPVEFSLGFWIKPQDLDGYLVYQSNDFNPTFTVLLDNEIVEIGIFIDSLYSVSIESKLKTEIWSFFMISFKYSNNLNINLSFNTLAASWITLASIPFVDNSENKFRIGSNVDTSQTFSGFLYEIIIFTVVQDPENLLSSNCTFCDYCFNSHECIDNCSLLEYPEQDSCNQCESACDKGCRTSETCNLCSDINCLYCDTYESLCSECFANFELLNGTCSPICDESEYLDQNSNTCNPCETGCQACESASVCQKCVNNSKLESDNTCKCLQGYRYYQSSCVRQYFKAYIGVKFNNDIYIHFTESLNTELKLNDLDLKINDERFEFTLRFIDIFTYKIELIYSRDIQKNSKVAINIIQTLISVDNSILENNTLTAEIYEYKELQESNEILRIETGTNQGMIVGIGASMILSIINYDLKGLLNFRNSAEIFSVIVLFNIPFEDKELAFLSKIHYSSKLPSFTDSLIDNSKGITLSKKLRKYGYNTSLMLLNSGMFLITILMFLISYMSMKILIHFKNLALFNKLLSYLEYDAFLTLWLQSYLEVSICSLISIKAGSLKNEIQIIDLIFSICCLVSCK